MKVATALSFAPLSLTEDMAEQQQQQRQQQATEHSCKSQTGVCMCGWVGGK
jgi:hypothetical protein